MRLGNYATGGKNYHAHKVCLMKADLAFSGAKLVVPDDLRDKLNPFQKVYLATCLQKYCRPSSFMELYYHIIIGLMHVCDDHKFS